MAKMTLKRLKDELDATIIDPRCPPKARCIFEHLSIYINAEDADGAAANFATFILLVTGENPLPEPSTTV